MEFHYTLYDALVSINVPTDRARAVVEALDHDMTNRLATKADLAILARDLGAEVRQEAALVRKDLEIRVRDVTIRNGYMLTVGLGVLFAALKLT
jgi:hypothetical protein